MSTPKKLSEESVLEILSQSNGMLAEAIPWPSLWSTTVNLYEKPRRFRRVNPIKRPSQTVRSRMV